MKQPIENRKITAFIPAQMLESAMNDLGLGVTETLKAGLEALQRERAVRKMIALRGKLQFEIDVNELRKDRD